MNALKKGIIYFPYIQETDEFIRYFNKYSLEYSISSAIFPNSMEKYITGCSDVELISSTNDIICTLDFDVLLVSDYQKSFEKTKYYELLLKIINNINIKELWIDMDNRRKEIDSISNIAIKRKISTKILRNDYRQYNGDLGLYKAKLEGVQKPKNVYITELIYNNDDFTLMLKLNDFMENRGIQSSIITNKQIGNILGWCSYSDDEIFENDVYDAIRKIRLKYSELVSQKNSDIVFIQAPDGLIMSEMTMKPQEYGGIKTYIMMNALKPSCVLCCVPDNINQEILNKIRDRIKSQYLCEIIFIITNKSIDLYLSNEERYAYIYKDKIESKDKMGYSWYDSEGIFNKIMRLVGEKK